MILNDCFMRMCSITKISENVRHQSMCVCVVCAAKFEDVGLVCQTKKWLGKLESREKETLEK